MQQDAFNYTDYIDKNMFIFGIALDIYVEFM
jgi:hypothetical protein